MTSILFVVSEKGYWGEECVDPLETLSDTNASVDVATPSGNKPVVDNRSIDPENVGEETAEWVKDVHRSDQRMVNPKPIAKANSEMYDAVVFPGGHGTVWDVNQDTHARALLREIVEREDQSKALVICHAVGLLAFTRRSNGRFLVEDRNVTGFPNEWEANVLDGNGVLPDGRKLPYWVEDEVKAVGGNWDAELHSDTSVTVDGDLITARGPDSSHEGGMALIEALGVTPPV